MRHSDEHIMTLAAGGQTDQIGTLFDRHHVLVFTHCYRMVGDSGSADDLVQETFLRVLRYRKSWRGQSRFTTWLYRIVRNVCLDHLSKERKSQDAAVAIREQMPISSHTDPAEQRESVTLLEEALQRLPTDKREIIIMCRYMELTYPEIARILECTVGAARVRFHRAINEMRRVYCALEEA